VPDDLSEALTADPAAADFFATLDGQNRYAILYRIQDAKKPETRVRRIEKYVAMLAEQKEEALPLKLSASPSCGAHCSASSSATRE
jgi:uncharacterized protein YdeI (YjbR/CyaY-like superfamily)